MEISKTENRGLIGKSSSQIIDYEKLRIRVVEFSSDYIADHWCEKGHIVHCLEGEFICELKNVESHILTKGMMFVVSDGLSSHRTLSKNGVKLLVIDGDFLKQ